MVLVFFGIFAMAFLVIIAVPIAMAELEKKDR